MKHLTDFIINAGVVTFATSDGSTWQMRQPTPEEAAAGDSAARLAREATLGDARLALLAGNAAALEREAALRATAARATYLLPLLLLDAGGRRAYDVYSVASLAEFEALPPGVIAEMCEVLWGPITQAIIDAKKKSISALSGGSKSASTSANGRS
jgi:hypothetical protein